MATFPGRFQSLAHTSAQWAANDATLMFGELAAADVGAMSPTLKIGDGVRPWSQLPNLLAPVNVANDYVVGVVTTLPPGSNATVTIDNTIDPPTISFGLPSGATGPANALAIGIVTTGAPGSPAGATITGAPPNQILNLTIPTGAPGPQGPVGPKGDPGEIALGDPSATVGLVAKPGDALTAMRSNAAPALDQSIAPTWTGPHTFDALVRFKTNIWHADTDGAQRFHFAAGGATFFGAVNGDYQFLENTQAAIKIMLKCRSTETAVQVEGPINGTSAAGFRISAANGGVWFNCVQPGTNGSLRWINEYAGAVSQMTLDSGGNVTTYGNVNALGGRLLINGHEVLTELGDGWLRLNSGNLYGSGVYTPSPLRADGGLIAPALFYGELNGTPYLRLNIGGVPRGSVVVGGLANTYAGYVIADGTTNPEFISNSGGAGIFVAGHSKWLYSVDSTQKANTDYPLTAISFNVASSRALKRETGAPANARDILCRLRPILYRLRAEGDNALEQLGLIAEEVHEVCPWLSSDGKSVAYDRLAVLLLADWQATRGVMCG